VIRMARLKSPRRAPADDVAKVLTAIRREERFAASGRFYRRAAMASKA
jgi:hypothetical protein